jgi:hypothetical protein
MGCKCELKIHERRRRTKHPVRVPIFTHEEHVFLMALTSDGIDARRKEIATLKRGDEKRALTLGVQLLKSIRRELYRS